MRNVQRGLLVAIFVAAIGCAGDESTAPLATSATNAPDATAVDAQGSAAAHVFYEVDIDGRTAVLDLTPNDTVVGKDYHEYMAMDHGLEEMPDLTDRPTCMYRGQAAWADGGKSTGPAWSALNTCKGFQGMVAIDGETWILAPGTKDDEVLLSRMSEGLGARVTVATIRRSVGPSSTGMQGTVVGHAEALEVAPTKWMELVIVSDAARFDELGTGAPVDALQIANLADAIFRNGSLTPSVAIVVRGNVVIPGGTDPWSVPATGEVDASTLLTNFGNWARTHFQFLPGDEYALLTQRDLLGSTVGLANISGACTTSKYGIVESRLAQAAVGTTLAHELGHSLGMNHDNNGGECAGPHVMAPSLSVPPSTTWSHCSSTALANFLQLSSSGCLNNTPFPSPLPSCGNGLVDPGEQCDCASSNCLGFDPCCNGSACQLIAGAQCSALDGCCSDSCMIVSQGTTCEAATACTPAATCSGSSSVCPEPAPLANGTACSVATFTDGRCFQGDCQSRNEQCAALWSGATTCPTASGALCTDLFCAAPEFSGCVFFTGDAGEIQVLEGSSCGSGQQCYHGACNPSAAIPVCEDDMPANACGGCSSLAATLGTACNTCGMMECVSPDEVACNVSNSSLCPQWVSGAWSTCSASCGGGTQTRSVTCQDSSGAEVSDAECAAAGVKPATQQTCNPDTCITYEWLVGSFGACSVECGSGAQSRSVVCVQSGTSAVVADTFCTSAKPASTQACSAGCNTGYQCTASTCQPINACDASPCAVGQTCTSTGPGTYSCADLNECGSNNGGCDPRVTCTNTTGGRTCGALDACHPGYLCPAATANCPVTNAADGTGCSDQNACTQTDVCVAGVCGGGNAKACTGAGRCQLPGSCNPSDGVCSAPVADPSCAHCGDRIKNSGETGVDCGGSQCLACRGATCNSNAECASGRCKPKKGKSGPGECAPLDEI